MIIRPYQAKDRDAFVALNMEWIEKYFAIEQSDLDQLQHPETNIIDIDGHIMVAEHDNEIVGCGAIIPAHHPKGESGWYEIIKMATKPNLRGQGLGRKILDALINFAEDKDAKAIWIETNRSLTPALTLYRNCAFQELPKNQMWPTPYDRCDIQFTLFL